MVYAETLKICRLCLCESQSLINLFRRNGRTSIGVKLISDLLRFEVSHNDGYPRFVCCTCLEKLTNFNSFKNDCTYFKTMFDKNYACLKECKIKLTQLETVNSVKQEVEEEIKVTVRSEDNEELLEDPLRLTTPFDNQLPCGILGISKLEVEEDEETSGSEDGLDIHEDPIEITAPYENQDGLDSLEDPLKVTTPYNNQDGMDIPEDPIKVTTSYNNQDGMDIAEDPIKVTTSYNNQDGMDIAEDPIKVTTSYNNQDGMDIPEDPIKVTTLYDNQDTMEIKEDPLNVTALSDNQNGMELHEDPLEMATPYDDQDNVDIPEDPLVVTAPYDIQINNVKAVKQETVKPTGVTARSELECRLLGISKQESEEVEETSKNELPHGLLDVSKQESEEDETSSGDMGTVEIVKHEMEENVKETVRSKMKNVKATKLETVKPTKVTERSKDDVGASCSRPNTSTSSSSKSLTHRRRSALRTLKLCPPPSTSKEAINLERSYEICQAAIQKSLNRDQLNQPVAKGLKSRQAPSTSQPSVSKEAINLERSYEICQAAIQKLPMRDQLKLKLKPPPASLSILSTSECIKGGSSGSSSSTVSALNSKEENEIETSKEKIRNKMIGNTASALISILKPVSGQPDIPTIVNKTPPVQMVHKKTLTDGTPVAVSTSTRHQTIDVVKLNVQRPQVIENSQEKTEVKDDLKRIEAKDNLRTEPKDELKKTEPKDDLSEISKEKYKEEWSSMDTDDDNSQSDKDFRLEDCDSGSESQSSLSSDETEGNSNSEEKKNVKSKSRKSPNLAYSDSETETIPSDKEELENFKMSKSKAMKIMQARIDKILSLSCTYTRRTSFPCDECDKTFCKTRVLIDHKKIDHGRKIPFRCRLCAKVYKKYHDWSRHLNTHPLVNKNKQKETVPIDQQRMIINNRWFQCDKCPKSFNNSKLLDNHISKHQKGSAAYTCLVCGKEFMAFLRWRAHLVCHGEKQIGCSKCTKRFHSYHYLKIHLKTHTGDKPYQCKICQKSYTRELSLSNHMMTHEDTVPFECDICHKTFNFKQQVGMHMLLHTDPKKLTCDQCGKICSSIYRLKAHKESHSSTPGFLCNLCGKTFNSNTKLKTHLLVHSGKKPFACDMCDKTFNRRGNLELHKSVHSESKAFMCDKCGKCFSRKVYLKYHKRVHERDNKLV